MDAFWDCSFGVSGRMALAALAHLGVDFQPLTAALEKAEISCVLEFPVEARAGGPGRAARVSGGGRLPRDLAGLAALLDALDVDRAARQRALAVLECLAGALAHAAGLPVAATRFSPEEALRALAGALGACWGLARLGVAEITASSLPWCGGRADREGPSAPLPSSAAVFLLRGKPVFPAGTDEELVTPLGAALVNVLARRHAHGPDGLLAAVGTGYGKSGAGLRLCLTEPLAAFPRQPSSARADHARGGREDVLQAETHLDHLSGEELGTALTRLSAMPQVLDVLWLPGTGKKNRPSGLLRVLCLPEHEEAVAAAVLRHTHTLGLRLQRLERLVLPRRAAHCPVAGRTLPAKAYELEGRRYVRPEARALEETAEALGVGVPALRWDGER